MTNKKTKENLLSLTIASDFGSFPVELSRNSPIDFMEKALDAKLKEYGLQKDRSSKENAPMWSAIPKLEQAKLQTLALWIAIPKEQIRLVEAKDAPTVEKNQLVHESNNPILVEAKEDPADAKQTPIPDYKQMSKASAVTTPSVITLHPGGKEHLELAADVNLADCPPRLFKDIYQMIDNGAHLSTEHRKLLDLHFESSKQQNAVLNPVIDQQPAFVPGLIADRDEFIGTASIEQTKGQYYEAEERAKPEPISKPEPIQNQNVAPISSPPIDQTVSANKSFVPEPSFHEAVKGLIKKVEGPHPKSPLDKLPILQKPQDLVNNVAPEPKSNPVKVLLAQINERKKVAVTKRLPSQVPGVVMPTKDNHPSGVLYRVKKNATLPILTNDKKTSVVQKDRRPLDLPKGKAPLAVSKNNAPLVLPKDNKPVDSPKDITRSQQKNIVPSEKAKNRAAPLAVRKSNITTAPSNTKTALDSQRNANLPLPPVHYQKGASSYAPPRSAAAGSSERLSSLQNQINGLLNRMSLLQSQLSASRSSLPPAPTPMLRVRVFERIITTKVVRHLGSPPAISVSKTPFEKKCEYIIPAHLYVPPTKSKERDYPSL